MWVFNEARQSEHGLFWEKGGGGGDGVGYHTRHHHERLNG